MPYMAGVSSRGSVARISDPNLPIDEEEPKSAGGMKSAALLWDIMGLQYVVGPLYEVYCQSCGQACSNPQFVQCTNELFILYR